MTHQQDPRDFSSDHILSEYARLNLIDWGRESDEEQDEPDEDSWEGDGSEI